MEIENRYCVATVQGGRPILTRTQHILSIALSALFLCAAYFALSAYARYDGERKAVEILTVRTRLLKQQQREMTQKTPILKQVDGFIRGAQARGLTDTGWAVYEVQLQGVYTFAELEEILLQCANATNYYFKPNNLEIRNLTFTGDVSAGEAAPSDAPDKIAGQDKADGDVLLTLTGAFVARAVGK